MAASYPTGFDTPTDPGATLSGPPTHSSMHNLTNDIVEAIEVELGLNPSGASATVAARFTADETLISKSYTICTSGTKPGAPTEGDKIFETDTNKMLVYSGAAWSTIGPVHGALTDWTPTITQSGSVTCTINRATYQRTGRQVTCRFYLTVTGSGTASNAITIGGLPVAARDAFGDVGFGRWSDASGPIMMGGLLALGSTTTVNYLWFATGAAADARLGVTGNTAALASTDVLAGIFTYEAAADA